MKRSAKPFVRGRIQRSRRSTDRIVRTRSVPVKRIPPSPWIGEISRHLTPTTVSDYEAIATASWSSGNFYDWWCMYGSTPAFEGTQWACYYAFFNVADAAVDAIDEILPPVRYSIAEAAATDDDYEWWLDDTGPDRNNNFPNLEQGVNWRGQYQVFSSATLLPVSGDSHVSDGKPTRIDFLFPTLACHYHIWNSVGGWSPTTSIFTAPVHPGARIRARYLRFRINGVADGPLYDLDTWNTSVHQLSTALTKPPVIIFPSHSNAAWKAFFSSYEFDFTAGDQLEVDIWWGVTAAAGSSSGAKGVVVSLARYDVATGSLADPGSAPANRVTRLGNQECHQVKLTGLEMAAGLDPSNHTYTFTPADGVFTFGKAQQSGSVSFSITSQKLVWQFNESLAGGTIPGDGTSRWSSDNGDPWALFNNSCTGGAVPVQPGSDPPAPTDPPSFTLEYGSCELTSPGRAVTITVYLFYLNEMAWLQVNFLYEAGTFFGETKPQELAIRVYRPASSSDYVDQVTDRVEGVLNSGPTGVFNHLGATVFELWRGAMPPAYDGPGGWSDDFAADVPTAITVTKVNQ